MTTTDIASSIQPQIDAWVAFDWQSQQAAAEATLQQTKELQKQSLQARKQLAETTKVFKKAFKNAEQAASALTNDGSSGNNSASSSSSSCKTAMDVMSKEVRVTIKAYQEEIDSMTRRCKAAESSYATLATLCFFNEEQQQQNNICLFFD